MWNSGFGDHILIAISLKLMMCNLINYLLIVNIGIFIFSDTAVGFTTKLSGSYSSTSSIIQGSTILYNGGNTYNGTVFTCPKPGLYLFHVTLFTESQRAGIYIYKNAQRLTLANAGNGVCCRVVRRWGSGLTSSLQLIYDSKWKVYIHGSESQLDIYDMVIKSKRILIAYVTVMS